MHKCIWHSVQRQNINFHPLYRCLDNNEVLTKKMSIMRLSASNAKQENTWYYYLGIRNDTLIVLIGNRHL